MKKRSRWCDLKNTACNLPIAESLNYLVGFSHLDASPSGPTGEDDSSASDVAFCTSRSKLFDSSLSSPVSLPGCTDTAPLIWIAAARQIVPIHANLFRQCDEVALHLAAKEHTVPHILLNSVPYSNACFFVIIAIIAQPLQTYELHDQSEATCENAMQNWKRT
jgi:hypothetical protein